MKNTLSEEEKNELAIKYSNVVHYFANRYRFFDPDIDEVRGWGFLGLAKAIHRYETDPNIEIEGIVFSTIKKEILAQYSKNRRPKSEESLQKVLFEGESSDLTLEGNIPDDSLNVSILEMKAIVAEALNEETEQFKKINMHYLFTNKDVDRIAEENDATLALVNRLIRRGQALIKLCLSNNDLIMDYLVTPDNEKGTKLRKHKEILSSKFGKIKYIRKYYSFLNENDIASLIKCSSFMIMNLLDYPTPTYLKASIDDSIKDKVIRYCERRYPGRLPSDVVTIPFDELTDNNTVRATRRVVKREYRNRKSKIEDTKERNWN